jgi:hypothetical protein
VIKSRRQRAANLASYPRDQRGWGKSCLKVELDDLEQRAVGNSLIEHRARLFELVEDTTRTMTSRRAASRELAVVASVLRRLRANQAKRLIAEAHN